MYLALENDDGAGGGHWHGQAASEDAVASYMAWRYPNVRWTRWRPGQCTNDPPHTIPLLVDGASTTSGLPEYQDVLVSGCDQRGRALMKLDGGLRSENERNVKGYRTVEVFQETSPVHVSNVATHSDNDYIAGPIRLDETYYTDRQYIITDLPDFLTGLEGVQTPNNDKHSPADDTEWLCFTISQRAAVYVLYDRRVADSGGSPPAWLSGPNSMFTNEHIATVSHTDSNMGFYNLYFEIFDKGRVCLGGNDAPGVGSNYLVLVGPITDLLMHPSHRVDINNLRTHSCPNGATTAGTATWGSPGALGQYGRLCCFEGSGPNCGNWDAGGGGAGGAVLPCAELPSIGIGQEGADTDGARPILGSVPPATFTSGGCVCPPGGYVGQRDCTLAVDLHQDANGLTVEGGDYLVSEIGVGDYCTEARLALDLVRCYSLADTRSLRRRLRRQNIPGSEHAPLPPISERHPHRQQRRAFRPERLGVPLLRC